MDSNRDNIISSGASHQPDHGPRHIKSVDQFSEGQELIFCWNNGTIQEEMVAISGAYQEDDEFGHWVIEAKYLDTGLEGVFALCDLGVVPFFPGRWQDDAWIEKAE